MMTLGEKIQMYEDFYKEFQVYSRAKKSLIGKSKENCPQSCLRTYEMREKIIEDFEKKYLTK
jgi:hypothetical protein